MKVQEKRICINPSKTLTYNKEYRGWNIDNEYFDVQNDKGHWVRCNLSRFQFKTNKGLIPQADLDKFPIVEHVEGFTFKVSAGVYYIDGKRYECKEQLITINPPSKEDYDYWTLDLHVEDEIPINTNKADNGKENNKERDSG